MRAVSADQLAAVLAPLAEAHPLPGAAFTSPDLAELEGPAIFERCWVPVAHVEDLPEAGDWVRAALPGQPGLIVLRDAASALVALVGVCAHRGTMLFDGDRGRLRTFAIECPYHGWAYDTSGELRRAPGIDPPPSVGLRKGRVAAFAGTVFVALDPLLPGLPLWIGGGPPWLARADLGGLRRARRVEWTAAANWKLLVQNFLEVRHVPRVHPGLERLVPYWRASNVVGHARWLGGVKELARGAETVSASGRLAGRPFVVPDEDRQRLHDAWIAPSLLISLLPDAMLTWRLTPIGPGSTRVVAELAVHEAALRGGGDHADLLELWDRVSAEDRAMCERQQRGLDAGADPQFAYAQGDEAVHAFDRWVAGCLLEEIGLREPVPVLEPTFDGGSHSDAQLSLGSGEETLTLALDLTTTEDR